MSWIKQDTLFEVRGLINGERVIRAFPFATLKEALEWKKKNPKEVEELDEGTLDIVQLRH